MKKSAAGRRGGGGGGIDSNPALVAVSCFCGPGFVFYFRLHPNVDTNITNILIIKTRLNVRCVK